MQIITNESQKELKKHGSDQFPLLVSHERLSRYECGSFLWHWHPEIEITYIEKGRMLYKVNRQSFHLKEGDMLFGNANVLHAGFMEDTQDCQYIAITFAPKLIYGFHDSSICRKYVDPVILDLSLPALHLDFSQEWHQSFADIILEIIALDKSRQYLYELDITMLLQKLWKVLLTNKPQHTTDTTHDQTEYERIKAMVHFIEENYMNKITLNAISGHMHLCESECSRLFKRYMNLPLFTFIQNYRIERSLDYLADTTKSIADVAACVGFTDPNYYSKVFARQKGCSPNMYRKQK